LKFTNKQYQTALKLYLGVPVYTSETQCSCGFTLDVRGVHSILCKTKGDIIIRHNAIRDVVHSYAKDAGLSPEKEKAGILGDHGDKRRPADVYIPNFSLQKDFCLDIFQAAQKDGHAADNY
jgi:hypothetical protein